MFHQSRWVVLAGYRLDGLAQLLLEHPDVSPGSEDHDGPTDGPGARLAGARADDDGLGEVHPRWDGDDQVEGRDGPRHLGKGIITGQRRTIPDGVAQDRRVVPEHVAERVDEDPGGHGLRAQDPAGATSAIRGHERRSAQRQLSGGRDVRGRTADRDALEMRGAEVQVRREQLIVLGREGRHTTDGVEPLRQQPVGFTSINGGRSRGLLGHEPQGEARDAHPSDPSISSFTRRLNSMAYSIGSSLVNTSRNPWTMRFWASFSVRPRLMR